MYLSLSMRFSVLHTGPIFFLLPGRSPRGYMGSFQPAAPEGFLKRAQAFFRSYFTTRHVLEYILATRVYSVAFKPGVFWF
jgi:hypothetical protein